MGNMTRTQKKKLIHEFHSSLGDASDPYAARGAADLVRALDKEENKDDLSKIIKALQDIYDPDGPGPYTKAFDKRCDKYHNLLNSMCKKYIPDNWDKKDLNWPHPGM